MAEPSFISRLRARMWLEWGLVATIVTLIAALATWTQWTSRGDNLFLDTNMQLMPAIAPDDIVIIAVDEQSLSQNGRWPWARDQHAQLLNVLAKTKPRAVALDILFTEPSLPQNDAALAASIANFTQVAPLLLPSQYAAPGRNGRRFDIIPPIPILAQAASGSGHVNTPIDEDGSVRRSLLCLSTGDGEAPADHLMLALYNSALPGAKITPIAGMEPCETRLMPRFARPGAFTTMSYASVANGEVPAAFFEDRFVLMGVTAQGLGDQYNVPSSNNALMPGVEINANILASVIRDDFIHPAPLWMRLVFALVPIWLLLGLLWRTHPWQTVLYVVGLAGAVIGTSLVALNWALWLPPIPALAAIGLVYPLWGWRRLQAISDYMAREFRMLDQDAGPLPRVTRNFEAADIVTLQAERLNSAIADLRDLQYLVTDSLQNLPDPAFVTDVDGAILLANRAASALADHDLIGDDILILLEQFAARADWHRITSFLQTCQKDANMLTDHDYVPDYVSFTNRQDRWFAMRRAPIWSAQAKLRGHIYYLADITAITHAQNEREEMIEFLSHDIRAPQAAILALLGPTDAAALAERNQRIAKHARNTLLLADNFVDMARMKSDDFAPEPVLLDDLLSEAIDSVWPLANARKITTKLVNNVGETFVRGEHNGLYRAMANLLDNAVKYSPDGGAVSVILSTLDLGNEPNIRIEIQDEGPGVAEDMLAQLFTKFKNTDVHSKGTVKGIGLGLYYAAMVIRRHGGEISLQNRKNGGAKAVIILPIDAVDPHEDA